MPPCLRYVRPGPVAVKSNCADNTFGNLSVNEAKIQCELNKLQTQRPYLRRKVLSKISKRETNKIVKGKISIKNQINIEKISMETSCSKEVEKISLPRLRQGILSRILRRLCDSEIVKIKDQNKKIVNSVVKKKLDSEIKDKVAKKNIALVVVETGNTTKRKKSNVANKQSEDNSINKDVAERNIIDPTVLETGKITKPRRKSKVIEKQKSCSNDNLTRENTPDLPSSQLTEELEPNKICTSRKSQEKKCVQTLKAKKPAKGISPTEGCVKNETCSLKSLASTTPAICENEPQASNDVVSNNYANEAASLCAQAAFLSNFQLIPNYSKGWFREGTPFRSKVFLTSDGVREVRKCYSSIRHSNGLVIGPDDCVMLKSGPENSDLSSVAKVTTIWENPGNGGIMFSLLRYYRPEQTANGRNNEDEKDEIFESYFKDISSVSCIENKCSILAFNEHYKFENSSGIIPTKNVFFCRKLYDYRRKRFFKKP